jgi:UDP-glucose 4-epimerase
VQLITGGKGFIGLNTARALLELGESCVLTTRHIDRTPPDFIKEEIGRRIFIEPLDVTDQEAFREIGKRHKITGIIHLTGAVLGRGSVQETFDETQVTVQGLLNMLFAAHEWTVPRVSVASTVGVYMGAGDSPFREDMLLPMTATHPLPMSKKILELLGILVAGRAGLQIVNLRIGGAWGPLCHHPPSPWTLPSQLVRAAVDGEAFGSSRVFAEDGGDQCYVKDCARAIALLQLAKKLNHPTYNIGNGRAMKNKELVAAIRKFIPEANIEVSEGFDPKGSGAVYFLDTTRLREDTGFEPSYNVERGVDDYIRWLRKGNEY